MKPNTTNHDHIAARLAVDAAESRRLVSSWLGPDPLASKSSADTAAETQPDFEAEEEKLFEAAVRDVLEAGIGAVPASSSNNRTTTTNGVALSENDVLRRQLLGRDFAKKTSAISSTNNANQPTKQQTHGSYLTRRASVRPSTAHNAPHNETNESEDEEPGRSALGSSKSKRKRAANLLPNADGESASEGLGAEPSARLGDSSTSRRTGSYLDEVLAEGQRKKKKKRKTQKQASATAGGTVVG